MKIDILSLFPKFFVSPFDVSIIKRAIDKNILDINLVDIRSFSKDKHQRVDDRPFGGGPGMVMLCQPLFDAIRSVKKDSSHVVYLSPQGKPFTSNRAKRLATKEHLVLVSGHYEGIDQRVIDTLIDEEISIGDYVLTNGCIASLVVLDSISRFIPKVIGNDEATKQETFENNIFEGPQYTKPINFEDKVVPKVLLSGNHSEIKKYKEKEALMKMKKVRPDLYFKYRLKQKQIKVKKVEKKAKEK